MPCLLDAQAVSSAVPPPTFRSRSGLPAVLSASLSSIECSASVRFNPFGPSPRLNRLSRRQYARTTMASADFCRPFGPPCGGPSHWQDRRSLRVRRVTFLPYTRRIYAATIRMTSGFESIGPLAHLCDASYAIHVLRAGSLPAASFGPRLAADALAFRLGVPVIKASTGTLTRPVTSRFAFALRLTASGMTLRVMPDAPKKTGASAKDAPVTCHYIHNPYSNAADANIASKLP